MRIHISHTQCDYHRLESVSDEAITKRCSPRKGPRFLTMFVRAQAPKQCSQTVAEHEMREELLSLAVVSLKQLESGAVALQFRSMHFFRVACPLICKLQMHPDDGKGKEEKRKANAILDFH